MRPRGVFLIPLQAEAAPARPSNAARVLSRLDRLVSSTTLVLVAALVVAAGSFAGSDTLASFTRITSNTANTLTAATIGLSATPRQTAGGADDAAGAAIFRDLSTSSVTIDKVIPGDTFTRYLTLRNTGDVAANFSVTVAVANPGPDAGITALTDGGGKSLMLRISECATQFGSCNTQLYPSSGILGNPTISSDYTLFTSLAANGEKYLQIYYELPSTVTDDGSGTTVQAKSATLTFTWKATQVTGTAR